jgi:UDP-glucose 4-epimerase
MTKVLITGANSFVGTNFLKYSQFRGTEDISLFDKKPEEIEFEKYEVVLHLAAIVHQSNKIPEAEYFRVNRDLCLRVAEQAKKRGIRQFVFLSTLKVYGEFVNGSGLRNEDSECFPDDAYGKSKYSAEIGLKKLEDENFTISIIRTPLIYGEGVKANMINLIKLVDSFLVLPLGKIENKRNFTYSENLVGYIDQIIKKQSSGIFIAMDEYALSTTELVNYLSKYLGKKVRLFRLPLIFVHIGTFFIPSYFERLYGSLEFDNSKTKEVLNFKPPYSSEEGIKRMVYYYLESKRLEVKVKS